MTATDRSRLRQQLRKRRRALTPAQQHQAARSLCKQLKRQPLFTRSQHIALYLPNDGEIDPTPIIHSIWHLGKHCYLPVLKPGRDKRLWFVPYTSTTPLRPNRFGIPEPIADYRKSRAPNTLDLVLMPLVGFDENGGRMGMGGGFYDRTFAFKQTSSSKRPYLLGLAHECQRVEQLELARWDIPLDAIATDTRVIPSHPQKAGRDFI